MADGAWRWEAYAPDGTPQVADTLDGLWWDLTAQAAADHGLALLLSRVHPDYPRLAGWRVRSWRDDYEGWADVNDWLAARADVRHVA